MAQIQDLLFGDYVRSSDARLSMLEARVRDLETQVGQRVAALHAQIQVMSDDVRAERRTSFDELARGVQELGEHIKHRSRT